MTNEKLDKILTTEEELIPSSGFLASVMERVHEEAAAPPPIPFPWVRAVPAMVVAAVVLGGGAVALVRIAIPAVKGLALNPPHVSVAVTQPMEQAGWVALALTASLLCSLLARRLAGRPGLL
jgi:hypothetical protein